MIAFNDEHVRNLASRFAFAVAGVLFFFGWMDALEWKSKRKEKRAQ